MNRNAGAKDGLLRGWLDEHPGTPTQSGGEVLRDHEEHQSGLVTSLYTLSVEQLSTWVAGYSNDLACEKRHRRTLSRIHGKLLLFGDSFEHGRLESCLNIDDELRQTVLSLLHGIGRILSEQSL